MPPFPKFSAMLGLFSHFHPTNPLSNLLCGILLVGHLVESFDESMS
jgi:hypothetical protein